MLKKIYKNKGFIYISNDNNDIIFNNILLDTYLYNNDKTIEKITNISKKIYYEKLKCKY